MDTERQVNINRLVTVGAGAMLWVSLIRVFMPGFTLGQAFVLVVWIAMGSHHYTKTFADFQRPLSLTSLIGLALLSPGWPLLYWKLKRKSRS